MQVDDHRGSTTCIDLADAGAADEGAAGAGPTRGPTRGWRGADEGHASPDWMTLADSSLAALLRMLADSPEPDAPTSATNPPAAMSQVTPPTAVTLPKRQITPSNRSRGDGIVIAKVISEIGLLAPASPIGPNDWLLPDRLLCGGLNNHYTRRT